MQLSPHEDTNVFNLFESVSKSFKATVLNGRCEVLEKASPTRLIRIALGIFRRRTAWDSTGFVQWRSALAYPRRLSPKSGQRLALSLARLAWWSATTSRSTPLRLQRHGHAAKARQRPRLRRLGIASRCKPLTVAKQPTRASGPGRALKWALAKTTLGTASTNPNCPVSQIDNSKGVTF